LCLRHPVADARQFTPVRRANPGTSSTARRRDRTGSCRRPGARGRAGPIEQAHVEILCQVVFLALNGLTVESQWRWQFTARPRAISSTIYSSTDRWSGPASPLSPTHRIRHRDASAIPEPQPNRAPVACRRHPSSVNQSDTVATQLTPMSGGYQSSVSGSSS
jgi:hypothetical protein